MIKIQKLEDSNNRPEIIRSKRIFNTIYGLWVGLVFAASVWGLDAKALSESHAYLPFLKLEAGLFLCGFTGALAGLLISYSERTYTSILTWLGAGLIFGWAVVSVPLQITPFLVKYIDPELGSLLHYVNGSDIYYRIAISCLWVLLFIFIIGVSQAPLVEQAVFSSTIFRKITPYIFALIIMVIGGVIGDDLINSFLREAIISMDETIEFVIANQGKTTDSDLARKLHAAALREVEAENRLSEEHLLFVGSYDEFFGNINVLAKFQGKWFNCTVIYNQPTICK